MPRILILLLAAFAAVTALPAQAEPPLWAPAHGQRAKDAREYRYVYYPTQQIYYSTEQQIWFWMNGSGWSFGVHLPAHFRAQMSTGVAVMLSTSRPFVEHAYVEKRYGRPWRARHERNDGQKRNHRHDSDGPAREAREQRPHESTNRSS